MKSDIRIDIPTNTKILMNMLMSAGFEAFVVGGCVRDSILGKEPKDWDITTNATPKEMMQVFQGMRLLDVGLKHGTLTVVVDKVGYEITTYRIDGNYSDGRHPDCVNFTRNLKEDLLRRDFTINALAYNDVCGVIDMFGGLEDIQNKVLRAVGNPYARLSEDALRIMRGLRFSSVLGFTIEDNTKRAMLQLKHKLSIISKERLNVELVKLLKGKNVYTVLVNYAWVLQEFIPEIKDMVGFKQHNKYHDYDVWGHTAKVVSNCPIDTVVRLAGFFHDIGKPICFSMDEKGQGHFYGHPKVSAALTRKIMNRLHFSNVEISNVVRLVENHDVEMLPRKTQVRRLLVKMGNEKALKDLVDLRIADVRGQVKEYVPVTEPRIAAARGVLEVYVQMKDEEMCFNLSKLAINGTDLINIGLKPSPLFSQVLHMVLTEVVEGRLLNNKEVLLGYVQQYLQRCKGKV